MKVHVKICGMRTVEDTSACIEAGADFVGFNFWPQSKRYIDPEAARVLISRLPGHVQPVGVFVGASLEEVTRVCEVTRVRVAQLHGGENAVDYGACGVEVWQVIRVRPGDSVDSLPFPTTSRALLDAHIPGFGGGGTVFDWRVAADARQRWKASLLLAGGLSPDNVTVAVLKARPWGVDVASGVESRVGVKDAGLVHSFVARVRDAEVTMGNGDDGA